MHYTREVADLQSISTLSTLWNDEREQRHASMTLADDRTNTADSV